MNKNITELFCLIDDFCNVAEKILQKNSCQVAKSQPGITYSEILIPTFTNN
ncbi:hypothetical protein [Wolbachia endosymbiont (group E) of Neria commutata]|uniref:hypothetical protein n=1 Tax=Wolbachia endosymbiont (group E) of Neria commutata TaxID=3066149 RepID=UPI003132C3BE